MSLAGVDAATVAALLASGSVSTSTIDKVVSLLSLVVSSMSVGQVQLRAVAWGASTTLECDDAPILIAKTDTPNGACPDAWVNASCSCLSSLADATSWTVPVALLSDNSSSSSSSSSSGDVLPTEMTVATVTSINRMFIPANLTSLSLVGQAASPVGVDVETSGLTTLLQGFIVALGTSMLTNFEMVNISLASATLDASFMPSSVTNMTLRNTALSAIPSDVFADRHDVLKFLDLSVNALTDLSLGVTNTSTIQYMNLSYNSFASIPSDVFKLNQLDQLDLRGNPITDVAITSSEFALLESLSLFEIDAVDVSPSSSCSSGNWTAIQGVSFCVEPSSSNSGSAAVASSGSSSSSNTAIYGGVGGGVGLVVLIALIVVAVRARRRKLAKHGGGGGNSGKRRIGGGKHGHMASDYDDKFDGSTMSSSGPEELLSHPQIVMNRLPLADVDVRESVSKGGFGEVFSGFYLGRHVAVKKVHPYYQSDPRRVEMFLHEIILMAGLQHPRIVEFIGVGWSALRHLMAVTEFMDSGDLRNVMLHYKRGRNASDPNRSTHTTSSTGSAADRRRASVLYAAGRSSHSDSTGDGSNSGTTASTQLTWETHKLKWAMQIAEALVYLHSLQPMVIHRDLKSKNVLVDASMDAKLSDFGISREHTVDETHMTTGVGTSFWIAPEVLLGGHYDEKADVFSFGIVLSELDTEDYPYWNYKQSSQGSGQPSSGSSQTDASKPRGLHQHAILGMVAAGELRPTFSTTCPLGVLQIAELCLQSDPAVRPTSAMVFHLLQQVQAEPRPFARIGTSKNSPTASSRSRGDSFF